MTELPPAAWHPDPHGKPLLRWWDGQQWTDHTAPLPGAPQSAAAPQQVSGSSAQPQAAAEAATGNEKGLGLFQRALGRRASPASSAEHAGGRRSLHGHPMSPWWEQYATQEVVGESNYVQAFKDLAREHGHRSIPEYGVELTDPTAALVPDPDNKHDRDAVGVWIDDRHLVGFLPRTVAGAWSTALQKLAPGTHLQVPARVWVGWGEDWNPGTGESRTVPRGSVTVKVPEPVAISPYNDLPEEPHTVLPWGRAAQLTGEEHHMDVLRTFHLGREPRHVAATLHVIDEPRRSGDPVRLVEARLDGQRVGVMSKTLSEQIADLVTYVQDRGRTPVARALVKGSDLRADVTIHVARTSDVPHRWLESVQQA